MNGISHYDHTGTNFGLGIINCHREIYLLPTGPFNCLLTVFVVLLITLTL